MPLTEVADPIEQARIGFGIANTESGIRLGDQGPHAAFGSRGSWWVEQANGGVQDDGG